MKRNSIYAVVVATILAIMTLAFEVTLAEATEVKVHIDEQQFITFSCPGWTSHEGVVQYNARFYGNFDATCEEGNLILTIEDNEGHSELLVLNTGAGIRIKAGDNGMHITNYPDGGEYEDYWLVKKEGVFYFTKNDPNNSPSSSKNFVALGPETQAVFDGAEKVRSQKDQESALRLMELTSNYRVIYYNK